MKVVDMKFYDINSGLFKFLKILDFIKVFSTNFGFLKFWGSKTQNFEISRKPFCRGVVLNMS